MNIQRHNVEDMSPQEIRLNLYITQLIIIGIGCLLAYILFQDVKEVFNLWKWEPVSILIIGGLLAIGIVLLDYVAMRVFPSLGLMMVVLTIRCFEECPFYTYSLLRS